MHAVKLNITDEILPKDSIKIEEIDAIPFYPTISFEEAQVKVKTSVAKGNKGSGLYS